MSLEDVHLFQEWLRQCIEAGRKQLGMTDKTLAWVLIQKGMDYFCKAFIKSEPP